MGQLIKFPAIGQKISKSTYSNEKQKYFVQEATARLEDLCKQEGSSTVSVETMQMIVNEFYRNNSIIRKSTRKD